MHIYMCMEKYIYIHISLLIISIYAVDRCHVYRETIGLKGGVPSLVLTAEINGGGVVK